MVFEFMYATFYWHKIDVYGNSARTMAQVEHKCSIVKFTGETLCRNVIGISGEMIT